MVSLVKIQNNMDKVKLTLNIELQDGKYTVQCDETGKLWALRNGKPWRDLTGDKLILALASRIDELEIQFNLMGY